MRRYDYLVAVLCTAACGAEPPPQDSAAFAPSAHVVPLHDGDPDPFQRAAGAALQQLAPSLQLSPGIQQMVASELSETGVSSRAQVGRRARQVDDARQRAGLPALVNGIPFAESRFDASAVSRACAAGAWQLLPETAVSLGLDIAGCELRDRDEVWTPSRAAVVSRFSPYRARGGCGIVRCEVDERLEFGASTRAALRYLERVWEEPVVATHPQRAPLTVLAYNSGEARMRWWLGEADDPFGELAACAEDPDCGMRQEHARYVPRVVAGAALVVCNALSDGAWAETDLCHALADAGLAPREQSQLQLAPHDSGAPALDDRLAEALARIDGADALQARTGRSGGASWVRVDAPDGRSAIASLRRTSLDDAVRQAAAELLERPTGEGRRRVAQELLTEAAADLSACATEDAQTVNVLVRWTDAGAEPEAAGRAAECVSSMLAGLDAPPELTGAVAAARVELPARG